MLIKLWLTNLLSGSIQAYIRFDKHPCELISFAFAFNPLSFNCKKCKWWFEVEEESPSFFCIREWLGEIRAIHVNFLMFIHPLIKWIYMGRDAKKTCSLILGVVIPNNC